MRDENGYCEHGVYVGGCGPDYMCSYCEDGISWQDYTALQTRLVHQNLVNLAMSKVWDEAYHFLPSFRNTTQNNPFGLGEWITALRMDADATEDDQLRAFVRSKTR